MGKGAVVKSDKAAFERSFVNLMDSTSRVRPLFFGSFGSPNVGDEAIALAWMEYYQQEYGCIEFEFVGISRDVVDIVFSSEKRFHINTYDKLFWLIYHSVTAGEHEDDIVKNAIDPNGKIGQELRSLLANSTHLHVIGGGYLSNQRNMISTALIVLRQLSDEIEIPVIFTGTSFGHHKNNSELRSEMLFRPRDWVDFRDDSIKHFSVSRIISHTFDDLIMGPSQFQTSPAQSKKSKYAAICIPGDLYNNWKGDLWEYLEFLMGDIGIRLLDEHKLDTIYVVSSSYKDDDWRIGRDILRLRGYRLASRVVLIDFSMKHPVEIRSFLAGAHLVVAGRFHFALLASSVGVPTIGVDTSYKIEQLHDFLKNVQFGALYTLDKNWSRRMIDGAFERHANGAAETKELVLEARVRKSNFLQKFLVENVMIPGDVPRADP